MNRYLGGEPGPAAVGHIDILCQCSWAMQVSLRAAGDDGGPGKYESVGKSQPVIMMINPTISTRTRRAPTTDRRARP
jgi:hypothetical protein